MTRDDIHEKFRDFDRLAKKYAIRQTPVYLEFLKGERELPCTAWGNPTYNIKGWKGPCYLITDGHYKTFEDLMTQTPWESYGQGNDPRCEHCMVHCGFEPSAALRHQCRPGRQPQDADMDAALASNCSALSHRAATVRERAGVRRMKPALVTGASGFLGWHVARVLLERGYSVRALLRPGSRVADLPVERAAGDLRDPASLERAVSGCGLVFHVAADYRLWAKDPGELYRSNVEGTRNLLEAARTRRRRARGLHQHRRLHRHSPRRHRRRDHAGDAGGYGRRLQALQVSGGAGGPRIRPRRLSRGHRQPHRARRRPRRQAHSHRQDRSRFSERRHAGLHRHRPERGGRPRHRRRPPAGLRAGPGGGALHSRLGESDPGADPRATRRDHRPEGAARCSCRTRWRSAPAPAVRHGPGLPARRRACRSMPSAWHGRRCG